MMFFKIYAFFKIYFCFGLQYNKSLCITNPRNSMFPLTSSRETLRFSANKLHCSSRDQSLSVNGWPVPVFPSSCHSGNGHSVGIGGYSGRGSDSDLDGGLGSGRGSLPVLAMLPVPVSVVKISSDAG